MRLVSIAVAAWIASCTAVTAEDLASLRGLYNARGTNFNGSPYEGLVGILPTSPSTCRIKWRIGGAEIDGICMRDGEMLIASYAVSSVRGLVAYRIKADGSLEGTWTVADQTGVGTEKLNPIPSSR